MNRVLIYKERYRILRKLGEGGSGAVYMAQDITDNSLVTVKKMKKGSVGEGYRHEAQMLDRIDHPAVPKLIEAFEDAIILEYVPGNSLDKYIRHRNGLGEHEAVRLGREILEILDYLHSLDEPIIYRDLKPSNIIIKPDGHVALIDFGAARIYDRRADSDRFNIGTSGFAAPEQYGSLGQTDKRTDIYCFGNTLRQMLKNDATPELSRIIDKCTRSDREDRFASCREIDRALKKCPVKIAARRGIKLFKIAAAAVIVALIISFGITHYEAAKSYAFYDAEQRMPVVKERLGNAGLRLKNIMAEGIVVEVK